MTLFVVPNFGGLAPRFADRLLDPAQSSFVTNLKPGNGDLRGFRSLLRMDVLSPDLDYRRVIKFYKTGTDDYTYFKSEDVNASALKSPLAQDAFDRIYYTEAGATNLRVTTYDNLAAGVPSVPAGIGRPTVAPTVTPPGGGTPDPRAYVYTYQTPFGSESAPSPPTIQTGDLLGTWTISGFGSPPAHVDKINIYRSATGQQSSGDYYMVGTIPKATVSFNDSMAADLVPLQPPLDSETNDAPLAGLQGLVQHSSGAFAGFIERTVYFSRPYLPHAWPAELSYPVGDKIVGLAAILNYVIVLTKGNPYLLAGDTPTAMAIVKLPDIEPCTSNRSIVVMSNACYFASPNGLCRISQHGLDRPTNPLLTREEFAAYNPDVILAASYGSYYIAFYESSRGFAVALPPYEPIQFVPLDRYAAVTGLDTDLRTGDLLVTQGNAVSRFDAQPDNRFPTTWRSKEFISTYPINLGAVQILFKEDDDDDSQSQDAILAAMEDYNTARWDDGPLDGFDLYPINGPLGVPAPLDPILSGLPPIQPLGGEPLYDLLGLFRHASTHFTLIADGKVRFSKVINDERVHSMPEGYKSTRFYVEVSGSAQAQRIIVAETRRECRNA